MKKFLFLIAVLFSFTGLAQDLHFSQTAQTPLLINPASAGLFDGWERVNLNQRNQWLGATTQFMSTHLSADANFYKSQHNSKAHLGVGLQFFNDVGGDSKFGTQSGSLTLNGILPVNRASTLALGIQAGFGSKKGELNNLTFGNQWNGETYDASLPSYEVNTLNSFTYADVSTGFMYVYDTRYSTFARHSESKIQMGFSVFHINQPKLKYISGSHDVLQRKYVLHFGFIRDFWESKWSIDGSILQFIQGGHYETILGALMRYRFKNGTKITGFSQDAFFCFGMYLRPKDALIPSIKIQYKAFQMGLSYDYTISKLRKAYGGGSFEISLTYTNMQNALMKKRSGLKGR